MSLPNRKGEHGTGAGQRILVVDDEIEMRELLSDVLNREGYRATPAHSGKAALAMLADHEFDLVLTDLKMADIDGLEVLSRVRELRPEIAVILISAFGSIDLATEAMRRGAASFVTKPVRLDELLISVRKVLDERNLRGENKALRREVEGRYRFGNILGKSKEMREVFALIERVAQGASNVLILGESGTGKELVAKALHYNGPRRAKPLVTVNCSALPEGLLESELFGHVRGAFTGAVVSKKGLFGEADGGTIFLDEIGEMSPALQAKLLRVLQDGIVRPVGGNTGVKVDARIITATNRDLEEAVHEGRFREDLYYRLSVIPIRLPSLRDRPVDIPLLIEHYLDKLAKRFNSQRKTLTSRALAVLVKHRWPGNVRELENVLERLVVMTPKSTIDVSDLTGLTNHGDREGVADRFRELPTLQELEDDYVKYVLEHVGGQKEKAVEILGINRRTLYRKRIANPDLDGVEPAA